MDFPRDFNMARYFLDDRLNEGYGEKNAVLWDGGELTYNGVVARSNRFANVLRGLGMRTEERVYICLPDLPEFAETFFGTLKAGAVVTMGNPAIPADDILYYLNYTRARTAIICTDVVEKVASIRDQASTLKDVLVVGSDDWNARMEKASPELRMADTTRDDVACWLFSGGTTGRSKGVVHRHVDFPYNTEHYAKKILQMRDSDITLSVPKLFFGYATGTNLMFPFSVGATTALFEGRSTADELFKCIRRFRPTFLTQVPTMINKMVSHPEAARHDLSGLRLCVSAGEALPPELYNRWKETFGVEVLDGIGSAEMFHIYISNRIGDVKPGSLGKIVPGYTAEIRGEDGAPVAPGEVGRLWITGESAGLGYFNEVEKSRETFFGGSVKTADLFREDEEGTFWYSGRVDDLMKVGGVFVAPLEVERALMKHPAVVECAVAAYRDAQDLEKPIAYVVRRGTATAEELQEFVKKTLAPYKYPRRVRFVESLPRTDRGKVDRKRLHELDS